MISRRGCLYQIGHCGISPECLARQKVTKFSWYFSCSSKTGASAKNYNHPSWTSCQLVIAMNCLRVVHYSLKQAVIQRTWFSCSTRYQWKGNCNSPEWHWIYSETCKRLRGDNTHHTGCYIQPENRWQGSWRRCRRFQWFRSPSHPGGAQLC